MKNRKCVVITRAAADSLLFAEKLVSLKLDAFYCPSIVTTSNLLDQEWKEYLSDITTYDWIIFTSSNGVRFFMDGFLQRDKELSVLKDMQIAVVGKQTGEVAEKYGLSVSFIPFIATAEDLAKELPNVREKKILIPRSTIGNPSLLTMLASREAVVTEMPVYRTEHVKIDMVEVEKKLKTNQILCLTFTSSSTVAGFMENVGGNVQQEILSLPVCSIGPVTSKTLTDFGFTRVYTAKDQTIDGMITVIRKSIL